MGVELHINQVDETDQIKKIDDHLIKHEYYRKNFPMLMKCRKYRTK